VYEGYGNYVKQHRMLAVSFAMYRTSVF